MKTNKKNKPSFFERASSAVARASGSNTAIIIAFLLIILWLITGPFFGFSDTWQLIINTGTTIITFLMVFLIQRNQNKDSVAIHLKLDELVVSQKMANKKLVAVEDINEEDLKVLQQFYKHLSDKAQKDEQGKGPEENINKKKNSEPQKNQT